MREFFIFEIKDEFKSLYQDKPSILYQILEQIYFLGEDNAKYGYSLFKQLTKKIDKDKLVNISLLNIISLFHIVKEKVFIIIIILHMKR